MTHSLALFEQALQAPTMEAVIALSERVQTLEAKPEGVVYRDRKSTRLNSSHQ